MKKVVRVKWLNVLLFAIFLIGLGLLVHDAYMISIANLFSKFTISLTKFGVIFDFLLLLMSEAIFEYLFE